MATLATSEASAQFRPVAGAGLVVVTTITPNVGPDVDASLNAGIIIVQRGQDSLGYDLDRWAQRVQVPCAAT